MKLRSNSTRPAPIIGVLVAIALLPCLTLPASEGLGTVPDSAAGLGMVGGRLALLDNPSVVRTNPASLVRAETPALMLTYQPLHGKTSFEGAGGALDDSLNPWKHSASLYYVHPLGDRLSAGIGLSAPFGTSIQWSPEGPLRYFAAYDADLITAAITPALALKINDGFSLGAGLDIYRSTLHLERRYPWGPLLAAPLPDGDIAIEGEGWGLGAYFAANLTFGERHHVSLVGRLPVSVSYSGSFEIDYNPIPGAPPTHSPFASEIEFPGSVGIGYGIDLSQTLRIGLDFEWLQNSTHDDLPLIIGVNQPLLGGADSVPLGWEDSVVFGLGVERDLGEGFVLRAGWQYADSPMDQRTWNPSVPADDRHILSVGVGWSRGPHTIDLAYAKVFMDPTEVPDNIVPAFNGTYRHDWDILALSYTLQF